MLSYIVATRFYQSLISFSSYFIELIILCCSQWYYNCESVVWVSLCCPLPLPRSVCLPIWSCVWECMKLPYRDILWCLKYFSGRSIASYPAGCLYKREHVAFVSMCYLLFHMSHTRVSRLCLSFRVKNLTSAACSVDYRKVWLLPDFVRESCERSTYSAIFGAWFPA